MNPIPLAPPMPWREYGRTVLQGLGLNVSVFTVAGVVAIVPWMHPLFSLGGGGGIVVALLLALVAATNTLQGRPLAVLALAALGALPMVVAGALSSCTDIRQYYEEWRGVREASIFVTATFESPFGAAALGTGVLFPLFARSPRFDRALRPLALLSLVVLFVPTVKAISRVRLPDPDAYVASVPAVQVLDERHPIHLDDGRVVALVREPPDSADASDHPPVRCHLTSIESGGMGCGPYGVRHDAAEDIWVLQGVLPGVKFFRGNGQALLEELPTVDLHGHVAPPRGWTVGSVIGLVLASAFVWIAGKRRSTAAHSDGESAVGQSAGDRAIGLYAVAITSAWLCGASLFAGQLFGLW